MTPSSSSVGSSDMSKWTTPASLAKLASRADCPAPRLRRSHQSPRPRSGRPRSRTVASASTCRASAAASNAAEPAPGTVIHTHAHTHTVGIDHPERNKLVLMTIR